jgi:hypothetical protein
MLWPKLVMSGVWSILCHFHCGRKMNHLAGRIALTKASDDAAIETFVKGFPNSLSNLLERLHHQQYNGLYMVL